MSNFEEKKIFSGDNLEEIAYEFATEVSRRYSDHLAYWQASAMDDRKECYKWAERMEREPELVRKSAYRKILAIMQEPKENKTFYKKRFFGLLRSKDEISITPSSGFYQDLLQGEDIKYAFSVNVEFLINKRYLVVMQRVYSQYTRL